MKRPLFLIIIVFIFSSCAPVLRGDLMQRGSLDVNLSEMRDNPGFHKGKLYILGGIIAKTTATEEGAIIQAVYIPVNSRGYLKDVRQTYGRFMAIYPGIFLDPLIFREKREITLAGEFVGTREGKIDEMGYTFPLFEIKELYLWEERKEYYYVDPYPYWYYPYPYRWYDPWWRHRYWY
jgi:outer membrane lipoprotein